LQTAGAALQPAGKDKGGRTLEDYVEGEEAAAVGPGGKVDVVLDLSAALGAELDEEGRVEALTSGGQLAAAGIRKGAKVTAFGSDVVTSSESLRALLAKAKQAGKATATITLKQPRSAASAAAMGADARADSVTKAAVKLVKDKKLTEALVLFEKAVEISPKKVELYLNLAKANAEAGNGAKSRAAATKGLAIDPKNKALTRLLEGLPDDADAGDVEGNCDDGFDVQPVKVGAKVQVRDASGSWGDGVVEAINPSSKLPSVVKDGWDMAYEWDECRVV
jgi:tetratricopeptide (TPR) repeat protein